MTHGGMPELVLGLRTVESVEVGPRYRDGIHAPLYDH